MKEYLTRFVGKKIVITRVGVAREITSEGVLRELAGDVAVLVSDDGIELGIPLDKILLVGPQPEEKTGRALGFRGA